MAIRVIVMNTPENLAAERAFRAKRHAIALDEGAQAALNGVGFTRDVGAALRAQRAQRELYAEQIAHDRARGIDSGARALGLAILIAMAVVVVTLVSVFHTQLWELVTR